ncbi:hypothetical protein H6G91_33240 [Nostoc muscorum FACHB-395]|nr:hypothetical protein [Desmonostoc muscorum FACHB-395]
MDAINQAQYNTLDLKGTIAGCRRAVVIKGTGEAIAYVIVLLVVLSIAWAGAFRSVAVKNQ